MSVTMYSVDHLKVPNIYGCFQKKANYILFYLPNKHVFFYSNYEAMETKFQKLNLMLN